MPSFNHKIYQWQLKLRRCSSVVFTLLYAQEAVFLVHGIRANICVASNFIHNTIYEICTWFVHSSIASTVSSIYILYMYICIYMLMIYFTLLCMCTGKVSDAWLPHYKGSKPEELIVKHLVYDAPNPKTWLFLVSSYSCLCPIHQSHVLSREWRCSWSSADRRCSKYIWMISKFIAY